MRELPQNLIDKIEMWAEGNTRTSQSDRATRVASKRVVVEAFFSYVGKTSPTQISAPDVRAWRTHLEKIKTPRTVYRYIVLLESYFQSTGRRFNPATGQRPPRPEASAAKKAEGLEREGLHRLLAVMREAAERQEPQLQMKDKRDYAMILLFMVTDMTRETLAQLDISQVGIVGGVMHVRYHGMTEAGYRKKKYAEREELIVEPEVVEAVSSYLGATGRGGREKGPVWVRHDLGRVDETEPLSAPALIHNLKLHAEAAGVGRIELYQIRRGYRRLLKEMLEEQALVVRKALVEDLTRAEA